MSPVAVSSDSSGESRFFNLAVASDPSGESRFFIRALLASRSLRGALWFVGDSALSGVHLSAPPRVRV